MSNHDCPRLPCSGSFFYLVLINCGFPIELDLERMTTPLSLPRPFRLPPPGILCDFIYTPVISIRPTPSPLHYCSSSSNSNAVTDSFSQTILGRLTSPFPPFFYSLFSPVSGSDFFYHYYSLSPSVFQYRIVSPRSLKYHLFSPPLPCPRIHIHMWRAIHYAHTFIPIPKLMPKIELRKDRDAR